MADERLRDLERRWKESGDPAAREAWKRAQRRTHEVAPELLEDQIAVAEERLRDATVECRHGFFILEGCLLVLSGYAPDERALDLVRRVSQVIRSRSLTTAAPIWASRALVRAGVVAGGFGEGPRALAKECIEHAMGKGVRHLDAASLLPLLDELLPVQPGPMATTFARAFVRLLREAAAAGEDEDWGAKLAMRLALRLVAGD